MSDQPDLTRRFSGVRRLYGDHGLAKLQAAHVIVIGIGGVGTWVVEALARNGVGALTLIDLDNVAESNVNRQLHALDGNFGKAKVTAMRERIALIHPQCMVDVVEDFITPDNVAELLGKRCDVVIDCVDDAKAKEALAHYCRNHQQAFIMSGSAGGRLDPTRTKVADLASVKGDRLLAKVRNQLRRNHGFPKASGSKSKKAKPFGMPCVYSDEAVIKPDAVCDVEANGVTGLNCAGYGSSVSVTATFGFTVAQLALNQLMAASSAEQ